MGRHRSFSSEFKRQIAREFLDGREGLHELARRHSQLRKLIRLWIRKYEAGEFSDERRDRYGSPRTRRKSPNWAQGRPVDDGGPVVFEPDVEVHPIDPHVNVLAPGEVALGSWRTLSPSRRSAARCWSATARLLPRPATLPVRGGNRPSKARADRENYGRQRAKKIQPIIGIDTTNKRIRISKFSDLFLTGIALRGLE